MQPLKITESSQNHFSLSLVIIRCDTHFKSHMMITKDALVVIAITKTTTDEDTTASKVETEARNKLDDDIGPDLLHIAANNAQKYFEYL